MTAEHGGARVTFGAVFAVSEFRALWFALVLSVVGDQLARVALTLLVYNRTGSPLLAAVTFAASVVPVCVGGVFLAGLADRFSRRRVMIVCDLARMVLVAAMVIPRLPIAALIALLFAVTMLGPPFTSARAAIYAEVLGGDGYVVGNAISSTTYQLAQVGGFAAGGALAALVGARTALATDAVTFACSALITVICVRARPAGREARTLTSGLRGNVMEAMRLVFSNSDLRTPMLLGWLAAFYNVPEGVAAPLATSLGRGASLMGFILAAAALGSAFGGAAFVRLASPAAQVALTKPLAIASCAVLTLFALQPTLPLAVAILFTAGVFDCFQVKASAAFMAAAPPEYRGQAFGIAQAGMSLGQGTAMVAAGAAAQSHSPNSVIAASGAIGVFIAVLIRASRSPEPSLPD